MSEFLLFIIGVWTILVAVTWKTAKGKKLNIYWWSIIGVLFGPIALFLAMKQPDRKISLADKITLARESSLKRERSGSQSKNATNINEHLQGTESWIKTTVDRLLGPIRFF